MTDTIPGAEAQPPEKMVRRLARALALSDDGEKNYLDQARALLTELRTPTEAMLDAGMLAIGEWDGRDPYIEPWWAMIDAARAE